MNLEEATLAGLGRVSLLMAHELSRRELLAAGAASAAAGFTADWRTLFDFATVRVAERVVAGTQNDFMIARHLRIEGTNREIGKSLAHIAKTRHRTSLPKIDPAVDKRRREFLSEQYPAMLERAKGVCDEFGLKWNVHGTDPIGLLYDAIDGPGCSTVYYPGSATSSGHPLLSRNYDFTTQTLAEMLGMPASRSSRPFTGDPYVIEMRPDRGYPSLYLASYDLLTGCIDGMNSKGLSVALLADDVSDGKKPAEGAQVGFGEIEITRFLLDTCADVAEAKAALKSAPQYYTFIPCHYIIGDRHGNSFVWERSIPEGKPSIVEGKGKPQVVTNHLLSEFSQPDRHIETFPGGSFNRYCRLRDGIASAKQPMTVSAIKALNITVQAGPNQAVTDTKPGRTLWHSVYDLEAKTLEIDFYLGESAAAARGQRRSGYLQFEL